MKFVFIIFVVLIAYISGQNILKDNFASEDDRPQARLFFKLRDPCSGRGLAALFNRTDAKCSLSCFILGGQQQGGYCDNGVCYCNQLTEEM